MSPPAVWPDPVDLLALAGFSLAVVVLPIIGYWLTVIDIRAYLRALRGALVRVTQPFHATPDWVRRDMPECIRALELDWPCTEAEIKQAYRRLAETLHPDRGGDRTRFLALQRHFEQALLLVRRKIGPK